MFEFNPLEYKAGRMFRQRIANKDPGSNFRPFGKAAFLGSTAAFEAVEEDVEITGTGTGFGLGIGFYYFVTHLSKTF